MPAMLLLNLKMPCKDGFDVLCWIRCQPHLRKLVVIMFSGSRLEQDVEQAFELGANSFVTKPVSPTELLQVIMGIHHYWFGCNYFPMPDDGAGMRRETRFIVAPR